jgi:hypothetical protein
MGRVRSKKISENNVLIKVKIIKYKMAMSKLLLLLLLLNYYITINTLKQAIQKTMSGREYVNIPTNVISS